MTKQEDSLQVRVAVHAWEKQAIYQLRYQVFVQEMAKPLITSDPKGNQLSDALDDQSILLYVQSAGELIATARLTLAAAEEYPAELAKVFALDTFKAILNHNPAARFGLGTKLAIKQQYRGSAALYLIITEFYRMLCEQSIPFWFGGCNPYLIALYERMGFRRFAPNFTDPGYGLLVPIVLLVDDLEHLRAVKSPLYRHARNRTGKPEISKRFLDAFPAATQQLNTRLVTVQTLWDFAEKKLGFSPAMLPLFHQLTPEQAMGFLQPAAAFSCAAGDEILLRDSVCNDWYLPLSGALIAKSARGSRLLPSGEPFGDITLCGQRQAESVAALTDSELLVIPRQGLERCRQLQPEVWQSLQNNLSYPTNIAMTGE